MDGAINLLLRQTYKTDRQTDRQRDRQAAQGAPPLPSLWFSGAVQRPWALDMLGEAALRNDKRVLYEGVCVGRGDNMHEGGGDGGRGGLSFALDLCEGGGHLDGLEGRGGLVGRRRLLPCVRGGRG